MLTYLIFYMKWRQHAAIYHIQVVNCLCLNFFLKIEVDYLLVASYHELKLCSFSNWNILKKKIDWYVWKSWLLFWCQNLTWETYIIVGFSEHIKSKMFVFFLTRLWTYRYRHVLIILAFYVVEYYVAWSHMLKKSLCCITPGSQKLTPVNPQQAALIKEFIWFFSRL